MGLWDNHGHRRLIMELRTACSPIKLDICYASTCSTVRLTTRLQLDRPCSISATDTAPRPTRSSSTTRAAPQPPTQHLGHRHSISTTRSISTIRTAPRPPTQRIDHPHSVSTARAAHRPHAQQYHIETQTNPRRDPPPYIQYSAILASTDIYFRETNFYHLQSIISQDTDLCLPHAKSAKMLYRTF